MSEKLVSTARRTGILGAGFISDFHIRAVQSCPGVQLTAVCDADRPKALQLQRKFAIPHCYGSLDEMLLGGVVDVVHVLVPPSAHAATASRCLEAGCDVFLEKPMAVSADEARALDQLAKRSGRTLGINHNNTFHPTFVRLLDAIRERRLGALQHVMVTLNVPLRQLDAGQHSHWMFRRPENIILEQACHPLSQICRLLGPVSRAVSLVGKETILNTGTPFYDTWQCSLVCERGTAQMFLAFGREFLDFSMHAIGQDGVADLDFRRNTFRLSQKSRFMEPVDNLLDSVQNGRSVLRQGAGNIVGYSLGFLKLKPPSDPFAAGMRNSIAAFYRSLGGGLAPREDSAAGRAVIEACEAIAAARQSAPSGMVPGLEVGARG
jgi:predicted dehydrogenase